jgi:hypothetical protein
VLEGGNSINRCKECMYELSGVIRETTRRAYQDNSQIGGRGSRGLGVGTSEGLPRENKDLSEVVKSDLNPGHQIWKGCVEAIHKSWRRSILEDTGGEYPKS